MALSWTKVPLREVVLVLSFTSCGERGRYAVASTSGALAARTFYASLRDELNLYGLARPIDLNHQIPAVLVPALSQVQVFVAGGVLRGPLSKLPLHAMSSLVVLNLRGCGSLEGK